MLLEKLQEAEVLEGGRVGPGGRVEIRTTGLCEMQFGVSAEMSQCGSGVSWPGCISCPSPGGWVLTQCVSLPQDIRDTLRR